MDAGCMNQGGVLIEVISGKHGVLQQDAVARAPTVSRRPPCRNHCAVYSTFSKAGQGDSPCRTKQPQTLINRSPDRIGQTACPQCRFSLAV